MSRRRAGVSTATVSRVLAGVGRARPETQARVLEAARALDYRPSEVARSLKRRSTQTLGLIITDIENPYFPQLVRSVEDAARASGYSVLLCNAADDPEREASYLDLLVGPAGRRPDHRRQQPRRPSHGVAVVATDPGRPRQHRGARRRAAGDHVGQRAGRPRGRRTPARRWVTAGSATSSRRRATSTRPNVWRACGRRSVAAGCPPDALTIDRR